MNDLGVTRANVRARIAKFGGQTIGEEGTNAHHDTTWLAQADGTVISSLRYDPWGVPRSAVPAAYTPFRCQGSWHDSSTDLAWVVTRWYAPSLGTFISEDALLGEPRDPDSRHLYAYGAGEPVGRWDPDGRRPICTNQYCWSQSHSATYRPRQYSMRQAQALFEALCLLPGGPAVAAVCLTGSFGIGWMLHNLQATEIYSVRTFKSYAPNFGVRILMHEGIELLNDGRAAGRLWARYPKATVELHLHRATAPASLYVDNRQRLCVPGSPDAATCVYRIDTPVQDLRKSWSECTDAFVGVGRHGVGFHELTRIAESRSAWSKDMLNAVSCRAYSARIATYADPWLGTGHRVRESRW